MTTAKVNWGVNNPKVTYLTLKSDEAKLAFVSAWQEAISKFAHLP
jgi:hypothetical protein